MATVELDNVKKRFGKTEGDSRHHTSTSRTASSSSSSVRRAAASPRCCAWSRAWKRVFRRGPDRRRAVNEVEPMDRDIAMVFQNYALYPHMSVRQHGLRAEDRGHFRRRRSSPAWPRPRRSSKLEPYLDRKPRSSPAASASALPWGAPSCASPPVFLFDEPLSNLDAKLRVQMRLEIKELQRKLGVTALYVTHDQVEAMTLADRMIVMNAGVAEQIGAPLEVYADPATLFVAGFIGSPPIPPPTGRHARDRRAVTAVEPTVSSPYGRWPERFPLARFSVCARATQAEWQTASPSSSA
jgi:sn-glycerol 3-phosphate transport system ATP-binding protein